MSASSPSRYFIAGDPLRGLAAISIVAYHAAALALIEKGKWPIGPSPEDWARVWKTELARVLPGAASGVRVFFVLSGYLIARPFVRAYALGEPLPSAGVYLRNRALRLLPALWVTFAVVVVWTGLRGASLGHVVRVLALSEHLGRESVRPRSRAGVDAQRRGALLPRGAARGLPLLLQAAGCRCWRALDNPFTRWLGTRSYAIYLYHFVVFAQFAGWVGWPPRVSPGTRLRALLPADRATRALAQGPISACRGGPGPPPVASPR